MKFRSLIKRILFPTAQQSVKLAVVTFNQEKSFDVYTNTTILQIAQKFDLEIPHYCGGNSRCGTCVVDVIHGSENLTPISSVEQMVLGVDKFQKGHRLACQARVLGDVSLSIPEWF